MIRNFLVTALSFLLIIVIAHVVGWREPAADFRYVNPSEIHTLDPARMSWVQDFRVALNIWEGLTTWHPVTCEPTEGAAYFPPEVSPDGLTYRFHIRPDARWSNGDPVTAADFVRGWRRGMEPGTAADYQFLFADHIAGAKEYIDWRMKGVRLISALERRSTGATITTEQAAEIAESQFAASATNESRAVHHLALAEHAKEMESRFREVGLKAELDNTLIVRLNRPCPYLLDLTSFPTLLPCHPSIEMLRQRFDGIPLTEHGLVVYDPQWAKPAYRRKGYAGLISNGPYQLADWTFKRRARLTVNPFFREADRIACRTIDMMVYDNLSAALMAYEAGDVDFLPSLNVPYDHELARLSQSGERTDFHTCVVLATLFLNFNCGSETVEGEPNPFSDRRVRLAFSLALDKHLIVDHVLGRGDRVAHSFVPPDSIPGYSPPSGLSSDVHRARSLLTDAGFPNGEGLPTIDLLHTHNDARSCQAMARMWEERLGARVELRAKESKTFAEDKAHHRFMISRGNWYGDYADPTTFLNCLISGNGNNDSGYSNPVFDRLMEEASGTIDAAARFELLRRAEAIVVQEDAPILPILHYAEPIAIQHYVHGLHPNPRLWFSFRHVRVDR